MKSPRIQAAAGHPRPVGKPAAVWRADHILRGLFDVAVPWGAAPGTSWPDIHARTYARTVIVVQRIGHRPRPNLEHMILHALLVAAGVTTLVGAAGL